MPGIELPADGIMHTVTWSTSDGVTTAYVDGEREASWLADEADEA